MLKKGETAHDAIFIVGRLLDTEGMVNTRRIISMTNVSKPTARLYINNYKKEVEPLNYKFFDFLKQGWVRKQ